MLTTKGKHVMKILPRVHSDRVGTVHRKRCLGGGGATSPASRDGTAGGPARLRRKTVTAGETIHFRVSSTAPYGLSICRLGLDVDDPAGDEVFVHVPQIAAGPAGHSSGLLRPRRKGLPGRPILAPYAGMLGSPWRLNASQTLISQHDYPTACGYGLFLDGEGRVQFYLGDGGVYRPERSLRGPALAHRQWQHVVGTWDGKTKSLWVNGKRVAEQASRGRSKPGPSPLRLGACGHDGPAVNLLDGDLAMPVIYGKALSADEIASPLSAIRDSRRPPATACWPAGRWLRSEAIAWPTARPRASRPHHQLGDLDDRRSQLRRQQGAPLRRLRSGQRSPARPRPAFRLRRPVRLPLAGDRRVPDSRNGQAGDLCGPIPLRDRRDAANLPCHRSS